ncbi:hypothetical protein M1N64_01865 [Peptococcaceae bacterium]|nr:hypothetical protein [Peptococcaceae bacterium]
MDWETNINIYMQVVTKEKSPEELRPDFCVHCQSKQFFHRHDHYTRWDCY